MPSSTCSATAGRSGAGPAAASGAATAAPPPGGQAPVTPAQAPPEDVAAAPSPHALLAGLHSVEPAVPARTRDDTVIVSTAPGARPGIDHEIVPPAYDAEAPG